jgi:dipeptidyl aminopeptidase/acylaminoacyl peptidase
MSTRPMTLEDYWDLKIVDEMALSPDGATVAYVVTSCEEATNSIRKAIWLAEVESGETWQLTSGEAQDRQPAWSPDGERLAFVSTRGGPMPQVYVMPRNGGEARRVSELPDGALSPVWAPDGRMLCISSPVKSDRQRVAEEDEWLEAHSEAIGSIPRMRLVDSLEGRFDARGYIDHRFHLFILALEAAGAVPRQITQGDTDHLDAAWSPDGACIAYASNADTSPGERFRSDIWTMRPNGSDAKQLTDGTLSASAPAWSPDGSLIAFYANPLDSFAGKQHLWVVSPAGGDARTISGALDRTRRFMHTEYAGPADTPPAWSPDGQWVYGLFGDGSDGAVVRASPDGQSVARVPSSHGDVAVVQCRGTADRLVCIASTPTYPYDVFILPADGGELAPLTRSSAALLERVTVQEPERLSFTGANGWTIEGWYIPPVGHEPGTPAPLILEVHGGPEAAWPYSFFFHSQAYAGAGYGSLFINPRGSLGRGYDFIAAEDWGTTDFYDQMAGVDLLVERGDADADRLAVTGISYGGFMTNWICGHTDRFSAAVSENGVSNLISLFGTSDICGPWFMSEMGGPFWTSDTQWEWYREHSPITYVGNITTPMLFLQAESDYRCPIEQGEQMLTALRIQGKTAALVRIPGASHSIPDSQLPHQRYLHWMLELKWFERYVKGAGAEESEGRAGVPVASVEV